MVEQMAFLLSFLLSGFPHGRQLAKAPSPALRPPEDTQSRQLVWHMNCFVSYSQVSVNLFREQWMELLKHADAQM